MRGPIQSMLRSWWPLPLAGPGGVVGAALPMLNTPGFAARIERAVDLNNVNKFTFLHFGRQANHTHTHTHTHTQRHT